MRNTDTITKIVAIVIMATILIFCNNRVKYMSNEIVINERELANANVELLDIKERFSARDVNESLKITSKTKVREVVYGKLTMKELTEKLNRVMKSSLAGKGELFASKCIELGVDPYIALAIVFQETGCYYGNCSSMVQQCNNIGGMKGGSARCWGGSYALYNSIDEGIINFISNLAYGYFYQGLTTPELMNSKYAEDPYWAYRVNNYVNIIKNS